LDADLSLHGAEDLADRQSRQIFNETRERCGLIRAPLTNVPSGHSIVVVGILFCQWLERSRVEFRSKARRHCKSTVQRARTDQLFTAVPNHVLQEWRIAVTDHQSPKGNIRNGRWRNAAHEDVEAISRFNHCTGLAWLGLRQAI
jgi:hypothetical protein